MAKKRKAGRKSDDSAPRDHDEFDPEETFDDAQDEFFAGRDKILLEEGPAAKRRRRLEEQERELQPSDEEVFRDPGSEDESDVADEDVREAVEDERDWGTSKSDYYNADIIETEADALEEEQEARRLQQRQLKAMTDADFGFDEREWADDAQQAAKRRPAVEKLPSLQVPESATVEERTQMLKSRYPEFEPLTKDFLALQEQYRVLKKEATVLHDEPVSLTKFRALSAYLGAIAMYLALLSSAKSGTALPPTELREHSLMTNLVKCRQLWQEAASLHVAEIAEKALTPIPALAPAATTSLPPPKEKKIKRRSKEVAPVPPNGSEDNSHAVLPKPKGSRKPKKNELQELLVASLRKSVEEESDFGDEDPLTQEEAADKARRKKSLRFYTSQIAQKANKRGAASRHAGGDDDVPYKERIRDRQERLMRQAEQRGKGDALGPEALDDIDEDDAETGGRANDEAGEYYDMLVSSSKQKKSEKRARAEAYAEAAREGAQVYEEEQVGPDGKRKITYAIEKNKGLTPKRKKDVRNPRVKKRKKYDEKMKKVGSMRQVYKGGEGRGGYGGEATGIKTHLVKSVKL